MFGNDYHYLNQDLRCQFPSMRFHSVNICFWLRVCWDNRNSEWKEEIMLCTVGRNISSCDVKSKGRSNRFWNSTIFLNRSVTWYLNDSISKKHFNVGVRIFSVQALFQYIVHKLNLTTANKKSTTYVSK